MIDKENVYKIVDKYLIEYVGNLVGPGDPIFDNKINAWIVPIFHRSKNATFPLAEIVLDSNGNIVYVPTVEQLEEIGNKKSPKFPQKVELNH